MNTRIWISAARQLAIVTDRDRPSPGPPVVGGKDDDGAALEHVQSFRVTLRGNVIPFVIAVQSGHQVAIPEAKETVMHEHAFRLFSVVAASRCRQRRVEEGGFI